jgi:type II secretory pathway pseudopilin PulG
MRKNNSKNQGFSFAEALIALSILIFILLAILFIYMNFSRVYSFQQATIRTAESIRTAANEMQSTVLQADKVVESHSFSGNSYSTDADTLVLEIPAVDGSGNILSGEYDYAVFFASGANLYKRVDANAASSRQSGTKQLSDSIYSVAFTYDNVDLNLITKVNADIQAQAVGGRQTVNADIQREMYLRNK